MDNYAELPIIVLDMVAELISHAGDFLGVGPRFIEKLIEGIFLQEGSFISRIGEWISGIISSLVSTAIAGASKPGGSNRGGVGRHATGLDYVPYDEYRAVLHKGERVLTAAENKRYSEGDSGPSRVVNVTVNAPHIGPAEEQHLIDIINREFGGK